MTIEERLDKIERDIKLIGHWLEGISEGLRHAGIHYTYKALDADKAPPPLRQIEVKPEDPPNRFETHVNQQVTE